MKEGAGRNRKKTADFPNDTSPSHKNRREKRKEAEGTPHTHKTQAWTCLHSFLLSGIWKQTADPSSRSLSHCQPTLLLLLLSSLTMNIPLTPHDSTVHTQTLRNAAADIHSSQEDTHTRTSQKKGPCI